MPALHNVAIYLVAMKVSSAVVLTQHVVDGNQMNGPTSYLVGRNALKGRTVVVIEVGPSVAGPLSSTDIWNEAAGPRSAGPPPQRNIEPPSKPIQASDWGAIVIVRDERPLSSRSRANTGILFL